MYTVDISVVQAGQVVPTKIIAKKVYIPTVMRFKELLIIFRGVIIAGVNKNYYYC